MQSILPEEHLIYADLDPHLEPVEILLWSSFLCSSQKWWPTISLKGFDFQHLTHNL